MKKVISVLCLVSLFILFGCNKNNDENTTINSKAQFLNILKKYNGGENLVATADASKGASTREYSETNKQVNDVDEADIVKTDGNYIYLISQNQVIISKAYPVSEMKKVDTISYSNFYPSMLYVDEQYLVVIGYYYDNQPEPKAYYYPKSMTKVYVFTKDNYSKPVNELSLDGYILTTRKIDDELILITNQYLYYWLYEEDKSLDPRPKYQVNDKEKTIDYNEIHYQEGTKPSGLVTVMKFNIDNANVSHYTYMGSGDNAYVSNNNIYLTQREYQFNTFNIMDKVSGKAQVEILDKTLVTKIDIATLKKPKTVEVKGYINNQFSLDEHKGYFRIVTTSGNTWDNTAENHLFIYDTELKLVGKVEGIAPGERIQSARFVGSRIYLVTFKNIDPFFVIDAENEKKPRILGELKIPGYSTYLHPYDENNIIGFGFETEAFIQNNQEFSRITGLKLSLFDVLDPASPKNKATELLPFGDSGYAYSELSYNHKALLFNKTKGIIAFPITSTKYTRQIINEDGKLYDSYTYLYRQSYKVFNVSLNGFKYVADISHYDNEKADLYRFGYEILRGLYIEDYLYTVSHAKIQVHSLKDYKLVKELDLGFNEQTFYNYYFGMDSVR